jgi:hypothetical protein
MPEDLILESMQRVLAMLRNAKGQQPSERTRRLAVTITEMEKVVAYYLTYVIGDERL